MIRRIFSLFSITVALGSPATAEAQTASDVARAETLFKDARQLADKGRYAEACSRFSESQRLASGIGVTLHLADCYERTGRTASAWAEFREAEKLAREREDPRAEVAEARAAALDRKLSVEQADTLFKEARRLGDSGHPADACVKFAESLKLAPAVGVTLYLADCYERTGRAASAWTEFREAEKLARAKKDARAETAHTRARALEGKLRRLTIAVPLAAASGASEIRMDGEVLPREEWNVALAVDPVDHVITLRAPGRAERTLAAHVEADTPALTVRFEDPSEDGAAAVAPVPPLPVIAAAPTPPAIATPAATPESRPSTSPERWHRIEWGLLGCAAAGVGVGSAFLVAKNDSMKNGGSQASPQVDAGFAAASAIGFAAGGAALVSAIVLYLATPEAKETALYVAPVPLAGGAGALAGARF